MIECGEYAILDRRDLLRCAFFHEQGDMDLMQAPDQESRPLLQRLVVPNVDQCFALFCFLQHLAITVVPSRTACVRVRSALPMQIRYHRSAPTGKRFAPAPSGLTASITAPGRRLPAASMFSRVCQGRLTGTVTSCARQAQYYTYRMQNAAFHRAIRGYANDCCANEFSWPVGGEKVLPYRRAGAGGRARAKLAG